MKQTEAISEAELISGVKRGDKRAFRILYEEYTPRIFQFSLSYLKSEADAEELVQEVFIKLWDNREVLDSTRNIKAYIFKIAVNCIYHFIRKKNIEGAYIDYARLNYKMDTNYTWHSLIFEEMMDRLHQIVGQLPEQQQKIFYLSKEKGMSNENIARELNLSKRTVENHLYRAMSILKKHFNKDSLFTLLFFFLYCG